MKPPSENGNQESILSRWLNRKKDGQPSQGVQPRPKDVKAPLSLGQKRLLFLQQLHPGNPFYHYSEAYRFKGVLDVGILLNSFEIVAQRHDVLRTKVVFENEQIFQEINDKPLFQISEHDLRKVPEEDFEKTYLEIAVNEAKRSLETDDGYLIRISLLRFKDDEYLLILTLHHILMDKWSMRVLQDEVGQYYQTLLKAEKSENVPLEIQYADYAYWQSLQKTNTKNLRYWTENLRECLNILNLPTDFPRPSKPSFRGTYLTKQFSPELSEKVKRFCKDRNKTIYVFLLTAFKILLKRYSGETDILVGSPFTNRDDIALENLIGFFNETLVMRSDLSGDPYLSDLIERVGSTTREAFAHKDAPFEALVKALKVDRDINYNPLFQVMFIYHNEPDNPDFGDSLAVEHEPFDFGVTKFDLTLFVAENESNLKATFEYSKDLFEASTVARFLEHLTNLVEEIINDPNRRISEFSILTSEEQVSLSTWNTNNSLNGTKKFVTDMFRQQVEQNKDKTAVSFLNDSLTYQELSERANAVANFLLKLNLDRKSPVGLLGDRSFDMIAGVWGILKAGLSYLPIDPDYPGERLEFVIADSSAKIVLAEEHLMGSISNELVSVVNIGEIIESGDKTEPVPDAAIKEEDLAYVIYTSGSTGKPKGVAVTHSNLAHSIAARFAFYPDTPESFLLLSSFSFDSSLVGIFWTLTTGGKLVVTKRRAEQEIDELAEIFKRERVTHTLLLPSLYAAMLGSIDTKKLDSLKTLIFAGEACPTAICKKHLELLPDVALYNEYGPTEATVWATAHRIIPDDVESFIPIGKPISGAKIHILDEDKNQVPIGVAGELYIGGQGVAAGYLNRPDLTKTRFLPFQTSNGVVERVYRTGDRGRFKEDGVIEFLGRNDNQVKLRGYRIEIDEIQSAIRKHAGVEDVVVKLEKIKNISAEGEDQETAKRLVAYVIPSRDLTKRDLAEFLKENLPGYMMPGGYSWIDRFPRLPNGKVDLDSLKFADQNEAESNPGYSAPKNALEQKLADIWEEVLGFKPIGVTDNFFEIGGDSILSIQIISKARKQGISLAPNQIFEHQTISELAPWAGDTKTRSEKETIAGEIPLLPIQHWFFGEHINSPNHWNQAMLIDMPDSVKADSLKKSIEFVVEYHDCLRLRFVGDDDNWNAKIIPAESLEVFSEIDLSHLSGSEIPPLIALKSNELQSSLDLSDSPLFKAIFFDCGTNHANQLLLFSHHLLIDHVSWQILFADLDTALRKTVKDEEIVFPAKTTSYKKWGELLVDFSNSGKFDNETNYWREQFSNEGIPTDFEFKLPILEKTIKTIQLELDPKTTGSLLKQANSAYNTEPFDLLLTAFLRAFKKWSGLSELCLGLESHGRKYSKNGFDLSGTIGWFTIFYPLLLKIENSADLESILVDVKEKIRSVPKEGIGFGVLKYLQKVAELDQNPPIVFNYLGNQPSIDFDLLGDREFLIDGVRAPGSERTHLLEVNAFVDNGNLKARVSYSESVHYVQSVEELTGHFENELVSIVNHCLLKDTTKYTPSDFPEADLNQDDLDNLLSQIG